VPQPPERCLSRQAGIVRCCLKKALCRKAAAAAYREQNKKSGRFLASARIFNKFSGYRG
jgi:hypothetical protein